MPDIEDHVLQSLEEHHVAKWVASEVDGMKPDEERFRAKVTVLIESVRHHVEEEETELFPQVRQALGRKALAELGSTMEQAKKFAPIRPHPRAPDSPPANLAAGAGGGVVDRVRDAARRRVRTPRTPEARQATSGGIGAASFGSTLTGCGRRARQPL